MADTDNLDRYSDEYLAFLLKALAEDADKISDQRKAVRREMARRQRERGQR